MSEIKNSEKMKTFKNLSIGDTIYKLCANNELGNPEKQQIFEITVEKLYLSKEGYLMINENKSYSGPDYPDLSIKPCDLDKYFIDFKPDSNTHRSGCFFINKEDANEIVKNHVVEKINSIEKSIPLLIKQKNNEIENLRTTFHEVLNKSYYKDFKLLKETV